jgi:hypothetical protein
MTPESPTPTEQPSRRGRRPQRRLSPVDHASPPRLEFAPPLADWIIFVAERLAAEFVREAREKREAP